MPEDVGLVNVDLKLNYLQPVVDGKIRAKGSCMRHGRTLSYAEARVFDEDEKSDRSWYVHGSWRCRENP